MDAPGDAVGVPAVDPEAQRMQALVVRDLRGPEGCEVASVYAPPVGDGRVILDVHAAGVTFPDLLLTRGEYQLRPELPFVPGFEVAGTVRSAPKDSGFAPGERAAGFVWTGGFAEQAAVAIAHTVPIPTDMSFETAAALVVNHHTAHFALRRRARIRPGETLLVHGGAGGVGIASIQVGRALGARVLATARSEAAIRVAAEAGADEVIETGDGWKARVLSLTGGRGVDVVLDPVGGDLFDDTVRCLAPEGRLLVVGFAAGEIPTVRTNQLLLRNVSVMGVAWGAFLDEDPDLMADTSAALSKMAREGYVAPVVGARYALAEGGTALRDLADRRFHGKAVLSLR